MALLSIPPGLPRLPHLPIRQRKQNGAKAEFVLRREEEETSLKKSFNSQSFRWGGFPGPWKTLKRQISGKGGLFSRGVLTQPVGAWERLKAVRQQRSGVSTCSSLRLRCFWKCCVSCPTLNSEKGFQVQNETANPNSLTYGGITLGVIYKIHTEIHALLWSCENDCVSVWCGFCTS